MIMKDSIENLTQLDKFLILHFQKDLAIKCRPTQHGTTIFINHAINTVSMLTM